MSHQLISGLVVSVALAAALLGWRRRWGPAIVFAVLIGAAFRIVVLILASRDIWVPWDFAADFRETAENVIAGRDPVREIREGGWHFLPPMAYVMAAEYQLGVLIDLPWQVVGRFAPVLADLALIPLTARLAGSRRAGFQYAVNPVAIFVSAFHGQIEPVALMFGVAALILARQGRAVTAGLAVGMAISVNSWPVLLVPGILAALHGLRARLIGLVVAGLVPVLWLLTMPLENLGLLLSTRAVVGDWGWTAILLGGDQALHPLYGRIGTTLLLITMGLVWYLWRRADPIVLTSAILLAFCVVTHRLGVQYLLWFMPYLLARPTGLFSGQTDLADPTARPGWEVPALFTAAGIWAGWGYLVLLQAPSDAVWWAWHRPWALASVVVLATIVLAMPWRARLRPGLADGAAPGRTGAVR
ncbi:hypothetical protein [Rhizohabitans arisaemae]|uniref:hypothetical protein n=1 Tax=Rhizohabitans arisaemae TaxID=2720610 RepID=UPI0024B0E430|nr:hypothetical protein [Rhizohabitans arisaemae]